MLPSVRSELLRLRQSEPPARRYSAVVNEKSFRASARHLHLRPASATFGSGIVKRPGRGQLRILSLPLISRVGLFGDPGALLRAGVSTLAIAPGCCGFFGPVPSATLDKRCCFSSTKMLANTPIRVNKHPFGMRFRSPYCRFSRLSGAIQGRN